VALPWRLWTPPTLRCFGCTPVLNCIRSACKTLRLLSIQLGD
jgi:hypothetical protein